MPKLIVRTYSFVFFFITLKSKAALLTYIGKYTENTNPEAGGYKILTSPTLLSMVTWPQTKAFIALLKVICHVCYVLLRQLPPPSWYNQMVIFCPPWHILFPSIYSLTHSPLINNHDWVTYIRVSLRNRCPVISNPFFMYLFLYETQYWQTKRNVFHNSFVLFLWLQLRIKFLNYLIWKIRKKMLKQNRVSHKYRQVLSLQTKWHEKEIVANGENPIWFCIIILIENCLTRPSSVIWIPYVSSLFPNIWL